MPSPREMNNKYILGIDTSNYKTSVAVIDSDRNIVCDIRRFLKVKHGEKGLRQSDALFQHVKNIPEMMEELRENFDGTPEAIAYSSRPRPVEGSYMPVFLAGESFARSMGAALCIPVMDFSHQEGHIEAVREYSEMKDEKHFMACHFSGGTTELLEVKEIKNGYEIDIIGGSKDISFGQVIDRAGVALGFDFPAGEMLDKIALETIDSSDVLTPIKVKDAWLNLSGIDTQVKNQISSNEDFNTNYLVHELFKKTADAMTKMVLQGAEKSGLEKVIMAGGVSSSRFIRNIVAKKLNAAGIEVCFDDNDVSQDNAVGTALLGGRKIWR